MSAADIIAAARDRVKAKRGEERLGQAAFNVLREMRPDLAEKIRSGDVDPYYCVEGSPRWIRFVAWLHGEVTP